MALRWSVSEHENNFNVYFERYKNLKKEQQRFRSEGDFFQTMPHDPDTPPAKKFKPGSVFFRLDRNKPGMLLPRKGNPSTPIEVQRKQLPIYQAKPQLLNQLRQLHNAILIGEELNATES